MNRQRIAVCASGEGTNFEALIMASRQQSLQADIVGLIASRSGIGAIDRAQRLNVPCKVISMKSFPDYASWDKELVRQLKSWQADWVVLAGFLNKIGPQVLQAFPQRVVNSHPALLPKFGGVGMFGAKVHSAVLAAREVETGVTIHLIDHEFDQGKILAQQKVMVESGDTAASLEARVKAAETEFLPRILDALVTGRITFG